MNVPAARTVAFNALGPGVAAIRSELDAAIGRVLSNGWFVLGPSVDLFERAFAAYHGVGLTAVGVGSGTDALRIALESLGIEPGDDVLTVANAGVPPVAAVVATGACPVFCDVDPATYNLDPADLERRLTPRSKALLVVHLYGRPAPMDALMALARRHGLRVLEDCAQAHGARLHGQLVGTFGDAAAFSFYPTKNLGALGDGGAVLTADPSVADRARLLRQYGWRTKYISERQATVSRLDELQAAILNVKLPHLDDWNHARQLVARQYDTALADVPGLTPPPRNGAAPSVYHLYVARVLADRRDGVRAALTENGVGTDVHYPLPAHLQTPYEAFSEGPGSLPWTEQLAGEVLSLPMYPELSQADAAYVADAVRAACAR